MSTIRIDKLLANLGYGSRKEIAALVKAGLVMLDEIPIKRADDSVSLTDAHRIMLDGEPIDPPSPLTIMLHKPRGYTCSHDERGLLVYDLLPPRWKVRKPALSAAGRLDKESTGQVIMTDDGDILHRIIHPKHHAAKRYDVVLRHGLQGNETPLFSAGNFLMQGDVKPLKPAVWTQTGANRGTMILHEGRFHQIRRMFGTLGNEVLELHRTQTGGLPLGDLEEGKYRILSEADIAKIFVSE